MGLQCPKDIWLSIIHALLHCTYLKCRLSKYTCYYNLSPAYELLYLSMADESGVLEYRYSRTLLL